MKFLRAVANAIYDLVAAVATALGFRAPRAFGWEWTVKDELGNSDTGINDLFQTYMKDEGIKAGQFALHVDGSLAMSTAYTWAEPEYTITQPDSVMRIASCSKAFTSAAILQLFKDRLLTGDERVFEFLGITVNEHRVSDHAEPADSRVRDILVRHLVGHKGGWNYFDHPSRDWVFRLKEMGVRMGLHHPPTKQQFAEFMFNVRLDFSPDTDSKYSNVGYLLLGMVVEQASKKSFIDYLNENILNTLSIDDVFVAGTRLADRRDNEVVYEDPFMGPDATIDPFNPRPAPLPYGGFGAMTEVMDSGGGLCTSAKSLSRFIFSKSVWVSDINDSPDRTENLREGNMPGTSAIADSFSSKDGSRKYDMAFIFNQFDKGHKGADGPRVDTDRLTNLTNSLEDKIRSDF